MEAGDSVAFAAALNGFVWMNADLAGILMVRVAGIWEPLIQHFDVPYCMSVLMVFAVRTVYLIFQAF